MSGKVNKYQDSLDFLYGLRIQGTKLGLNNIRRLLSFLGNPQRNLRFFHIAGTNGKGSVAAMLQALLRTTRQRVGLFISPHLEDFRERISINARRITPGQIVSGLERIRPLLAAVARSPGCSHPTYFEVVTALACLHFRNQNADAVVWEVGMGGRLDATNVVDPEVSVITNVSLDHSAYLGDSLEEVAREKAGIIKPGVPLVTAETDPLVLKIIRHTCRQARSPLIEVDSRYMVSVDQGGKNNQILMVAGPRKKYERIALPLQGVHQIRNFLTALAAWEEGEETALSLPPEKVRRAISRVKWPGRFEMLSRPFPVILDGAHNPAGARVLAQTLRNFAGGKSILFILGILADKDAAAICRELVPLAKKVMVVRVMSERAIPSERLTQICRAAGVTPGVPVMDLKTLEAALEYCYYSASPEDQVCIAGSLYLVGEARSRLREMAGKINSISGQKLDGGRENNRDHQR